MRHRSRHPLPTILGAALLAVACADRSTTEPRLGAPSAEISDGAHMGGNAHFYFLPPMVKQPTFDGTFNPTASIIVRICEWDGTNTKNCFLPDFTRTTGPGSETIRVNATDEHYIVNWHTDQFDLSAETVYRILVIWTGGTDGEDVFGYADVQLSSTPGEMTKKPSAPDEEEMTITLVDGRTLPIKFRVEEGAGCEGVTGPCTQDVIDLAQGGTVILDDGTGDYIEIPAQQDPQEPSLITVTLQRCADLEVDIPTLGQCLRATADPALTKTLFPRAIAGLCSVVNDPAVPSDPNDPQRMLMTLYRKDDGAIVALPNAVDKCEETQLGNAETGRGLFDLARARGDALVRGLGEVFLPRVLHASIAVLDVGEAGSTETFSDFQFVLPAQMEPLEGTDRQTAEPESPVANPPGVLVTDRDGRAVNGATVHFEVTLGDGTIEPMQVVSGAAGLDGVARLDEWVLGAAGENQVRAFGFGIAGSADDGPFMPATPDDPSLPTSEQPPVEVGTGEVFFTATATAPVGITIFLATFTNDALDAQPGSPEIGAWTTVDRSAGTIRVRSAVGDLENRPVELNQAEGLTGGVDLVGTVAGTPPTSGQWAVRWRSLINSADAFFAPILLRGSGGILASLEYRPDGQLTYNSSTNDIGITWVQGTAQMFEILVDLDAGVTSLKVDGSPVADQQNVPFVQAATSLALVGAELGGTVAQIFAWDDIEIGAGEGQITFESNRTGDFDIWVVNPDPANPNPTNLSNDLSRDDRDPAWAFDGTKIAFSRDDGVNEDIWVMDRDGANQVQLTTDAAEDIWPTWSPDGTKIAWTSKRTGFWEIWVMDANGANQTQLTFDQNSLGNLHPSWSSDGTKIAIHSGRDGGGDAEIVIVDISAGLASPTFTQLTNNSVADLEPVWSPDGSHIAFTRQPVSNTDILVIEVATLTESVVAQTGGVEGGASWSPDGTRLAFMNNGVTGDFEIFTVKLDGTNVQRLTFDVNVDRDPAWR